MRSMFNKEFFKCSQFTHINRCTFSLVINIAFCNIKRLRIFLTQKKSRFYTACKVFFYYSTVKLPETAEVWKCKPVFIDRTYEIR